MSLLELIFTLTLLIEGGSGRGRIDLFYHPEQDATLPCKGPSSYGPQDCSSISWIYNRDSSGTIGEVERGNIVSGSGRDDRLSLNPDCSLVIRNITEEDVGLYTCRLNQDTYYDVAVYLSILSVRPSGPRRDGEVLLECTLFRYKGLTACRNNGLRWVDDSGSRITEGVQESYRGSDCLALLTVKLQSSNPRAYICQSVRFNKVEIEAEYTPESKGPGPALTPVPDPDPKTEPDPKPDPDPTYVIVGVLVGVLLLLVVTSAVLIRHRRGAKVTEDVQTPTQPPDEPEADLTYATVSHMQPQEVFQRKEEEEDVTYSAVRPAVRTETDHDPSSLYSYVSRAT